MFGGAGLATHVNADGLQCGRCGVHFPSASALAEHQAREKREEGLDGADGNATLAAARKIQSKLSLGENGAKKRRKYSVEKYLSHPQFCNLGSASTEDKAKYDENFERIFGAKPPPIDPGPRDGYSVRVSTGKHEAIELDFDDEITPSERAALKARMVERLRRSKR